MHLFNSYVLIMTNLFIYFLIKMIFFCQMKKVQRFSFFFFFACFRVQVMHRLRAGLEWNTVCEWTSNPVTQLKASQIKGLDLFPVCNNLIDWEKNIIVLLISLN